MSGRKQIQVDESQWYRLLRSADELKVVRRDLPKLLQGVRDQTRADLAGEFDAVRRRQDQSEQAVRTLSARNRALEEDTNRRLREQAARTQQRITETAGRLRAEAHEQLERQRLAFAAELDGERRERRAEIAGLASRVEVMTQDREHARELSAGWLTDAEAIAALVADTLPHERHAPGELASLRARLDQARGNHDLGRYDAALAVAQENYLGLSELRVRVEQADLHRRSWQAEAVQAVLLVEQQVRRSAQLPVLGPDQQEIPDVALDVDYWSAGGLAELRERLDALLERARAEETAAEEAERICREEAPALEMQLADTVRRARLSQLASQIRVNLADEVIQALAETAFYSYVDDAFVDADARGAHITRLRHENGNEIVLDIETADPASGRNVIRVISSDRDTESEADQRARADAVHRLLAENGHQAHAPAPLPLPQPGAPDLRTDDPRYDLTAQREPGRRQPGPGA
ncbi:hypothetical protein ACFYUY_08020 [Kitasatospora sp. NPDC004745]|uniref:hypothetical protein n=1 Tax=unclassified Kitasatospora TaxID=2633591 RepID=UPI0033D4E0F1